MWRVPNPAHVPTGTFYSYLDLKTLLLAKPCPLEVKVFLSNYVFELIALIVIFAIKLSGRSKRTMRTVLPYHPCSSFCESRHGTASLYQPIL